MTTDKGQDALEELRRLAEMHRGVPGANPLTPPIRQTLERLAAAWEKERAGFEALMPHVDTIKELAALRVEVQAVEEEMDTLFAEWGLHATAAECSYTGCDNAGLCEQARKLGALIDHLRKARMGE